MQSTKPRNKTSHSFSGMCDDAPYAAQSTKSIRSQVSTHPRSVKAKYYAMIEWFDETCGALFENLNQAESTIILWFFTYPITVGTTLACMPYENGVRTPVILRWPAKIKPRIESGKLAENIDVFPTLLAAAGVASPDQRPGIDLLNEQAISQRDSIFLASYAPHGIGQRTREEPHFAYVYRRPLEAGRLVASSSRGREPKAVAKWQKNPDASIELFDLSQDPQEETNLASQHPERVRQLNAKINQWWTGKATSP